MQRNVEFYFDYMRNYLYDAAPMQKVKIPITLEPHHSAQRQVSYDGIVQFEKLPRLREVVTGIKGEVEVKIHCKKDRQDFTVVQGTAKAHILTVCQRCNGELGLDLELEFDYSPVGIGKSSDHLPSFYDVVEMDEEGNINLHQLVEDELMLALPIIPMHEESDCRFSEKPLSFGEIKAEDDKPNPFEILKQLKKDS